MPICLTQKKNTRTHVVKRNMDSQQGKELLCMPTYTVPVLPPVTCEPIFCCQWSARILNVLPARGPEVRARRTLLDSVFRGGLI